MTPEERALLADLKMYDQADERSRDEEIMDEEIARRAPDIKDKKALREAQVRYDAREFDKKHKPEIGPVDENLKLEEPDYEIPWSGKIDENKKVLGNATETAKLAMLDFDDTYLPEEVKRVGNILGNTVGNLDPAGLAAHAAPKAAIIFPSVAAEKAFMRKFLKNVDPKQAEKNIASHMRHTDKARDELTTAYYRNMQDGVLPHPDNRKSSQVTQSLTDTKAEWGDPDAGRDEVYEVKVEASQPEDFVLNNDGQSTLDHEGLHDYAMQAGIQSGSKGYYSGPMKSYPNFTLEREVTGLDVNSGRPGFRNVIENSSIGKAGKTLSTMGEKTQNKEFNNVLYNELMKLPSFRKMSAEKQIYAMELLGDGLSMDETFGMLNKAGNYHVVPYAGHAKDYPKESKKVGLSGADVEMAANLNEGFADPEIGRMLKEAGINNENFLYPVHLKSDDIDVDALVEQLKKEGYYNEADNLVPRPSAKDFKVKFGGPEYKKMLEEDLNGNPERLDAALEAGDIGDRYGKATTFDVSKDLSLAKGAYDKVMFGDVMAEAGIPSGLFPRVLRDNLMPKILNGTLKTEEEIRDYLTRLAPALKRTWKMD